MDLSQKVKPNDRFFDAEGNPAVFPGGRSRFNGSTLSAMLDGHGLRLYVAPEYNPDTYTVGALLFKSDSVTSKTVALSDMELAWNEALQVETNISRLWNAANSFIHEQISGGALVEVKLAAVAGNPSAVAVADWYRGEWAEYYRRRDEITSGSEANIDFSDRSNIPIRVRELMGL